MFLKLFWIFMTYIIGSFPFGLLVAQAACGVDPRRAGSRNIGATNVARLCGFGWGVLTLLLDVAKGFVPVVMAAHFSTSGLFLSLVALAAIIGHMHSIFLNYTGGKAVATTVGVFLALVPKALVFSALLCVAVIAATGYVSLGSLTLAASLPLFVLLTWKMRFFVLALAVMVMIFWKHRENIARLARGEEKTWRKKG
jgi:glycerol-3-phosphate acyltransferase PlsY